MKTTIIGIKKILTQCECLKKNIKNPKKVNREIFQNEEEKVFFNRMIETIKEADEQIERGEGRDADEVFEEWNQKYGW